MADFLTSSFLDFGKTLAICSYLPFIGGVALQSGRFIRKLGHCSCERCREQDHIGRRNAD